jgi:hypothetical protein
MKVSPRDVVNLIGTFTEHKIWPVDLAEIAAKLEILLTVVDEKDSSIEMNSFFPSTLLTGKE